jgi:hypothetical protein
MSRARYPQTAKPEKKFILRGHDATTRKDKVICIVCAPNLDDAARKLGGKKASESTFQRLGLGGRGQDFIPGPKTKTFIIREAEAAGFQKTGGETRQRATEPLSDFECFNLVEMLTIK